MMNDPIVDQIRKALFKLDNYCLGKPVLGEGTDVSLNRDKEKNTVSFSVNMEASRLSCPDGRIRNVKKFLIALGDVGIDPLIDSCGDVFTVTVTVPNEHASAIALNKARRLTKARDMSDYSLKIVGDESDEDKKSIAVYASRRILRQVNAPACVQKLKMN